jgi:hypothetical protein
VNAFRLNERRCTKKGEFGATPTPLFFFDERGANKARRAVGFSRVGSVFA